MLRYCAWCGRYQGFTQGEGCRVSSTCSAIDTYTICRGCLSLFLSRLNGRGPRRTRRGSQT